MLPKLLAEVVGRKAATDVKRGTPLTLDHVLPENSSQTGGK
jgi:hypothetical protein